MFNFTTYIQYVSFFCRPIVSSNTDHPKWDLITPHNLTDRQATITLDTNHQSAFQLRAVNKIGMSDPAYLIIRPPFQKVPDKFIFH